MRAIGVALMVILTGCSGGNSVTETPVITTPHLPTTIDAEAFVDYQLPGFAISVPSAWPLSSPASEPRATFWESHVSLGLPPTVFVVEFEEVSAGYDLDGHIAELQAEVGSFARLLNDGTGQVDGAPSLWFTYVDMSERFEVVHRLEVTLADTSLITFTLWSPVEFYESDALRAERAIATFTRS